MGKMRKWIIETLERYVYLGIIIVAIAIYGTTDSLMYLLGFLLVVPLIVGILIIQIDNNSLLRDIRDGFNKNNLKWGAWSRTFDLFNNDYIALGLFAEEHTKKTYFASDTATFRGDFDDAEISEEDTVYDEVSNQMDGCEINLGTGFGIGTTEDVDVFCRMVVYQLYTNTIKNTPYLFIDRLVCKY